MRTSSAMISVGLFVASATLSPHANAARACQTFTCLDTIYYSSAAKTKVVGTRSTCPGRKGLRGKATRWFDREPDSYEICTTTPPNVPCEFQPQGCVSGAGKQ